jgi:hypothetical protein
MLEKFLASEIKGFGHGSAAGTANGRGGIFGPSNSLDGGNELQWSVWSQRDEYLHKVIKGDHPECVIGAVDVQSAKQLLDNVQHAWKILRADGGPIGIRMRPKKSQRIKTL